MALARRERWVVTTAELHAAGASEGWIARRRASGLLDRQHRGVYLVGRDRPTQDERERAALKACGPDAALACRSAGARWRVRAHRGPVEVIVPSKRRHPRGVRVLVRAVDPRDVTRKDGVRITTLARTLLDLAALVTEAALLDAVHEAEIAGRLHLPTIDGMLRRAGQRPRGGPALRRALRAYRPVHGRVDRDLERAFLGLLRRHAFPPCRHNVTFRSDDGRTVLSLDVYWDEARVGVELDGGVHTSTRHFTGDRRKTRRMEALFAVTTVRVTWADLREHEAELVADLWSILDRRRAAA